MSPEPDTQQLPGQENGTEATADFRPVLAPDDLATTEATGEQPSAPGGDAVTEATGEYRAAAPDQTADFAPSAAAPPAAQTIDAVKAPAAPLTGVRSADRTDAAEPSPPDVRTGRFVLRKFHAKGGMGEIWLADDGDIGRQVAVKKMRGAGRPDQKDRFLLEAQITGQLEHPGVVPIHELGVDDEGQPYYVMKFIQGRTLKDVLDDYHAIPPRDGLREVERVRLLQTFIQLCHTVAFAHSKGIIHRDLKPDNVMVGAFGETQLLDWGLAKPVGSVSGPESISARGSWSGESLESVDGSVKGTPAYMAPEVAEGRVHEVDRASDIYLLGATLYHMLTGKRPRESKKVQELLDMARRLTPPPPRKLDPTIPKPLEAIVLKAMAHNKEQRYLTAAAMAEDMQRFLAGEPVAAYRENVWERLGRWVRKHRTLLARCAAALVLLGLGLFGWTEFRAAEARRDEERQAEARKLKTAEEDRDRERRKTEELQRQKKARADAEEFRRLADETQRHFALQNPFAEFFPSSRHEETEASARAALATLAPWGADLADLPPTEDRPALREQLYEVLLLVAETKAQRDPGAGAAKEALALLDRATALRPGTRGLYRLQAECHERLRDGAAAAAARKKGEGAGPPLALDHFLTAERHALDHVKATAAEDRKRELGRAAESYREATRADYRAFWAHCKLGLCHWLDNQGEQALTAFDTAVSVRPDSPWGRTLRGTLLGRLQRHAEAHADLERAIQKAPDLREAVLQRGVLHWLANKDKEALDDFERVLRPPAAERLIEAAFYRGQLHMDRGRQDEALKNFNLVLAERKDGHVAHRRRAVIHFARGDTQRGLADLNAYLTRGEKVSTDTAEFAAERAHQMRVMVRELSPEFPRDLPPKERRKRLADFAGLWRGQLEAAVERGAKSAAVYDELGGCLEQTNDPPGAVAAYTEAIERSPKEARLLVKRGWAYEKLAGSLHGQKDVPEDKRVRQALEALRKAGEDFRAALRLEPRRAEALAGVAYIEACLDRRADGTRYAGQALLHGGHGDPLVLINVACAYATLAARDPQRAVEFDGLTLDVLRHAVELWGRDRTGPDVPRLIETDSTFHRLRGRPEYKELMQVKR